MGAYRRFIFLYAAKPHGKTAKECFMKRFCVFPLILAVLLVMGLFLTACGGDGSGSETYDPITFTSKDAAGNTYKLTITKNTAKAAFTPGTGDFYSLTITYANGTTKTSTGTVASYDSTEISFVSATKVTFTITRNSNGRMTKIEGTINFDDGGKIDAPGAVTPEDNPGGGGTTPPAANPFANTTWKASVEMVEDGKKFIVVDTISFGTDTWEFEETVNGVVNSKNVGHGTYTVSGNTATLTDVITGDTETVTISGNVLMAQGVPFAKS